MATGNQYDTLTGLLKAIADAIRSKAGDVGLISAQDFPTNINAIVKATGNATTDQVLSGATFSNNSGESTGTMPNNGGWGTTINPGGSATVPAGYHNGSGTVKANMPSGNAGTGDVLSGKTFSNSSTNGATGTMTNRGAWSTTINPGGSVTIPAGYHSGGGKVSANNSSKPTIKYKNSVSSNSVAKLSYTFDSHGTYRVLAAGTIRAYHGGLIEFYTNGSISSTYYSNTWSKGNGVYGGQAEGTDRTTIVFFGDIVANSGNRVSVGSVENMDCFFTLCVERLP